MTEAVITTLEDRLHKAEVEHDMAVFEELFAEDMAVFGIDGRQFGKRWLIDELMDSIDLGSENSTRVANTHVTIIGAAALVVRTMHLDLQGDETSMTYTRLWERREDKWVVRAGFVGPVVRRESPH